jgi:hypothetical protein
VSNEHRIPWSPQAWRMKKALLLCALACAACDEHGDASWTEAVVDHANLTLLHESDATGDWVTLIDEHHVELCMFSVDSNERLDYASIAHICGFEDVVAAVPPSRLYAATVSRNDSANE